MKCLAVASAALLVASAHAQTAEEATILGRKTIAYLECAGLTLDVAKANALQEKGLVAGRAYLTYRQNTSAPPTGLPLSSTMFFDTLAGPTLDFRLGQLQMLLISGLSNQEDKTLKVAWPVRMKTLYQERNCDLLPL